MAQLILLRHGQSQWNKENRYTGWVDVPLSEQGETEAAEAGKKLADFKIDVVYTTPLQRANQTFRILWANSGKKDYILYRHSAGRLKDWSHFTAHENEPCINAFMVEDFNERYYGDLQGLNKEDSKKTFGEEQVRLWRRSYDISPPNGESLKDTLERVLPAYQALVEENLRAGNNVLIVAHGNSLRAISKHVENISDDEILNLEIPTGTPIVYELDGELKVLSKEVMALS